MLKAVCRASGLALVAGLIALAVPAQALPTITVGPGGGTFGNPTPAMNTPTNPFFDTFAFVSPFSYARTAIITITSNSVNFPKDNVNFITNGVKFNGTNFVTTSTGLTEIRSISKLLAGSAPGSIEVRGHTGPQGSYSGTITFAGVPEPTTWLMMILGFGFVGAAMRARKTNTTVSYA